MVDGGAWKRNAPFLEHLGKSPAWKCGGCGRSDNWHKRAFCRCGREPPPHVCRAQKRDVEARSAERREGRGKSTDGQHDRKVGGASYAQMARNGGSSSASDKANVQELEALRKQLAAERREKEQLQARANKKNDDDEDMDDGDDDAGEEKEKRITVLTSDLQSVARVCGEASSAYKAAKEELDRLVKERREGKPLRTQLQNAERRIGRQKAKIERLTQKSAELDDRIKELRQEQENIDAELVDAAKGLGALERERKQLLLREARGGDDEADDRTKLRLPATIDDTTAWNHVCAAVASRASQPGADPLVAQQLGALMQSVAELCQKLGGVPVASSPTPPAAARVQAADGVAQDGAAAAGVASALPSATGTSHGSASSASPTVSLVPLPNPPLAPNASAVGLVSAEDCIASAAPPAASTDAATGSFFIGSDGGQSAALNAPGGTVAQDGDKDGTQEEDVYISGSEAESALSAGDMDIQSSLAAIPPEQRGRVREALARRRQQQKGHRKLKKPVDEAFKGAAGDAKKPFKE